MGTFTELPLIGTSLLPGLTSIDAVFTFVVDEDFSSLFNYGSLCGSSYCIYS
jgi:hypothetical protein